MKKETQKITFYVEKNLLEESKKITQLNTTDTIKTGLKSILNNEVCFNLKKFRGSYKSNINLKELRNDKSSS